MVSVNQQKIAESFVNIQSSMSGRESAEELLEIIRHKVANRTQALETSFSDVDFADLGVVQMRDFRDVLSMHGIILNDDQVEYWTFVSVSRGLMNIERVKDRNEQVYRLIQHLFRVQVVIRTH